MSERKALLLVGSPRGLDRSTSGRLGRRLLDNLKERGFETDKIHVHAAVRSAAETERALAAIAAADVVVLSLPLYVDSFPAPVIALLERLAERIAEDASGMGDAGHPGAEAGRTRFALLIQCGFPERTQNATALAIAERFATEVGWKWLGGLAFGSMQTFGASATKALARGAEAIAEGKQIPEIALKKPMPAWLYRLCGNFVWRREAKRNGAAAKLCARPYEK